MIYELGNSTPEFQANKDLLTTPSPASVRGNASSKTPPRTAAGAIKEEREWLINLILS
jgi:hypothetical protein